MNGEASKEMKAFLGGDATAARIATALFRHEGIRTPEELREARAEMQTLLRDNGQGGWDSYEVPCLLDTKNIGPGSIARIDAALAGEL